jgi:hypothetical protein
MSAAKLLRAHETARGQQTDKIAERKEREKQLAHLRRIASAIRQGFDVYSPLHPGLVNTHSGLVDPELEDSRPRASAAFAAEVIEPIAEQIRQDNQMIQELGTQAGAVWAQLERDHPGTVEEIFAKRTIEAQAAVTEADQKIADLRAREQAATLARLKSEQGAERHRAACAEALAAGLPLPDPPMPTTVEFIDPAAFATAIKTLGEAAAHARRGLDQATAERTAYHRRRDHAAANKLIDEIAERLTNAGVSRHMFLNALSQRPEFR